jgi:hypothetical protein
VGDKYITVQMLVKFWLNASSSSGDLSQVLSPGAGGGLKGGEGGAGWGRGREGARGWRHWGWEGGMGQRAGGACDAEEGDEGAVEGQELVRKLLREERHAQDRDWRRRQQRRRRVMGGVNQ